MSRIDRRKWETNYMNLLNKGGLTDLFDNMVKVRYRISDDEYDTIVDECSDEELDIFVNEKPTFGQKRRIIELLNKYVKY